MDERTRAGGLDGARVLIVENVFLVASDIERIFADHGCTIFGVADSAEAALVLLSDGLPDLAVVSVWLGGAPSLRLATVLLERGVPVVLIGDEPDAPEGAPRGVPCVCKPFRDEELIEAAKQAQARLAG